MYTQQLLEVVKSNTDKNMRVGGSCAWWSGNSRVLSLASRGLQAWSELTLRVSLTQLCRKIKQCNLCEVLPRNLTKNGVSFVPSRLWEEVYFDNIVHLPYPQQVDNIIYVTTSTQIISFIHLNRWTTTNSSANRLVIQYPEILCIQEEFSLGLDCRYVVILI